MKRPWQAAWCWLRVLRPLPRLPVSGPPNVWLPCCARPAWRWTQGWFFSQRVSLRWVWPPVLRLVWCWPHRSPFRGVPCVAIQGVSCSYRLARLSCLFASHPQQSAGFGCEIRDLPGSRAARLIVTRSRSSQRSFTISDSGAHLYCHWVCICSFHLSPHVPCDDAALCRLAQQEADRCRREARDMFSTIHGNVLFPLPPFMVTNEMIFADTPPPSGLSVFPGDFDSEHKNCKSLTGKMMACEANFYDVFAGDVCLRQRI